MNVKTLSPAQHTLDIQRWRVEAVEFERLAKQRRADAREARACGDRIAELRAICRANEYCTSARSRRAKAQGGVE